LEVEIQNDDTAHSSRMVVVVEVLLPELSQLLPIRPN